MTEDQIADLRAWINAGAPWPDEEVQRKHREQQWSQEVTEDGVLVKTIGGLSDTWTYRRYPPEKIWAFQPVSEVEPPLPSGNPVDAFIDARLREKSLTPAPAADPVTLIRRATYDLHGLPPSPGRSKSLWRPRRPTRKGPGNRLSTDCWPALITGSAWHSIGSTWFVMPIPAVIRTTGSDPTHGDSAITSSGPLMRINHTVDLSWSSWPAMKWTPMIPR